MTFKAGDLVALIEQLGGHIIEVVDEYRPGLYQVRLPGCPDFVISNHVLRPLPDTLYPTKTRLELLAQVTAGNVIEHLIDDEAYVDPGHGETSYKVTARVAELEAAGWVELPEGSAVWALTPAGQHQISEATS